MSTTKLNFPPTIMSGAKTSSSLPPTQHPPTHYPPHTQHPLIPPTPTQHPLIPPTHIHYPPHSIHSYPPPSVTRSTCGRGRETDWTYQKVSRGHHSYPNTTSTRKLLLDIPLQHFIDHFKVSLFRIIFLLRFIILLLYPQQKMAHTLQRY